MPKQERPGFSFPGPVPKEALAYIKNKGWKVGFSYEDVWKQEHAYAFTVAKAMQIDVLETIRAEVEKALAEGRTLQQFKKDLTPTLQRLGWWGTKEMVDPATGETVAAKLGSPRRLRTIYNTNLRTARAAGQWERAQRTKAALPYLRYSLGPSKEHRPEHESWSGTVLPVDHPWWGQHYPPNGLGCKCRVRQVSDYEMKKRGWEVSDPQPDQMREWVNKRTGEVEPVPQGIDPGWNYNPGRERQSNMADFIAGKLNTADETLARVAARDVVRGPGFRQWFEANEPRGNHPVGVLFDEAAERIGSKARAVLLSPETAMKQRREHPELSTDEYGMVQETIDRGREIQDTESTLVYLLEEGGYVSVIKATRTGKAIFMQSFRRLSADAAKRDREIRRLEVKGEKFRGGE